MLTDVNTTDIADAIRLGCRTMQSVFNADDHDIPFFQAQVWPEAFLGFDASYNEAHVPGRHLLALLEAENALGVNLDEKAIEKHAQALFFSFSGPLPFPLNRQTIDGPLVNFLDHNLREGLHGLYALAKHRADDQAHAMAESCIRAIFDHWHPDRGWDKPRLEGKGLNVKTRTLIWGLARSIGPLVKYHRLTRHAPALELALLLADKLTDGFFREDGGFDIKQFGAHTHSTTCTLSGLAQLADLRGDARLMDRVRAFYDNGLKTFCDELGWVQELAGLPGSNPDRGECNNTGDILETALILGRWGWPEYHADAERILRCHLLPAQLRDISFIEEPDNPDGRDGKRDVARRLRGAFGFPAPYGHRPLDMPLVDFCLDIVGGAVNSLCEAYREIVRSDETGIRVNLLFDHETAAVAVESPYTHKCLRVRVRREGPLLVRIPDWVDHNQLALGQTGEPPRYNNGYLCLAHPTVGRWIAIEFPLARRDISLAHRTRNIRVQLRGDEIIAMENFGARLTFFASPRKTKSGGRSAGSTVQRHGDGRRVEGAGHRRGNRGA